MCHLFQRYANWSASWPSSSNYMSLHLSMRYTEISEKDLLAIFPKLWGKVFRSLIVVCFDECKCGQEMTSKMIPVKE